MTVYLTGSLPKDDLNGFTSAEKRLAKERHAGRQYLIVGVVEVKGAKEAAPDWRPEPVLHLTHAELVTDKFRDQAGSMLVSLYQDRTGRVGLDFPGGEEKPETLAITAESAYRFKVTKDEDGSLSIELLTAAGQVVGSRHALRGEEFKDLEFAVGAFDMDGLPDVLKPFAETLLAEWGIDADDTDDVVDAEVVDGGDDQ